MYADTQKHRLYGLIFKLTIVASLFSVSLHPQMAVFDVVIMQLLVYTAISFFRDAQSSN